MPDQLGAVRSAPLTLSEQLLSDKTPSVLVIGAGFGGIASALRRLWCTCLAAVYVDKSAIIAASSRSLWIISEGCFVASKLPICGVLLLSGAYTAAQATAAQAAA